MTANDLQTPTFSAECVRSSDQVLVRVSGRLVVDGHPPVWEGCLDRVPISVVRIDLGSVTEIDASGLGLLADFTREARADGRRVALVSASPRVRKLLQLTHLDLVLEDQRGPMAA